MDPEQRQRIIGYFLEESQEYLELLEPGVQHLDQALADAERINELYRAAHSIKGGAAMLELHGIQKVSYRLESSLKYMKNNPTIQPTPEIEATLLQGVEGLKQLTQEVRDTLTLGEELSHRLWSEIEPAFDRLDEVLAQQVEAIAQEPVTAASDEAAVDLPLDLSLDLPEISDSGEELAELSWDDMEDLAELSDVNGSSSGGWLSTKENDGGEPLIEGLDELANLFEENPLDNDDNWELDRQGLNIGSASSAAAPLDIEEASLDSLFDDDALDAPLNDPLNELDDREHEAPNPGHSDPFPPDSSAEDLDLEDLFNDGGEDLGLQSSPGMAAFSLEDLAATENFGMEGLGPDLSEPDLLEPDLLEPELVDESSFASAGFLDDDLLVEDVQPAEEPPLDVFSTAAAAAALESLESELANPDNQDDEISLGDLGSDGEKAKSLGPDQNGGLDELDDLESLFTDSPAQVTSATDLEVAEPEVTGLEVTGLEVTGADPQGLAELASRGDEDLAFGDLDSLLEDIAAETSEDKDFDDLDSLLNEPIQETSGTATASLEAVIDTDAAIAPASPTHPEADFADMEELLQQADAIGGPATSPSPGLASPPRGRSRSQRLIEQSMRVPVKTLDNLSNLVGEMVVTRNSLEGDQDRLRQALDKLSGHTQQLSDVGQQLQDLYERSLLENALLNSRRKVMGLGSTSHSPDTTTNNSHSEDLDDLELDRFTGFHTLSQDIIELIVRIKESTDDIDFLVNESLDQVSRNFRQTTSQLQEDVNRSRMVPFSQTADRLPRAVREISRKCGKEASLTVDGRETLIDKMLVEQLHDPLTHLINNAVTHGIETQDERILAGKPPTGNIRLQAFYQGNQTVISIADDGAGIDPVVVKRKAIEKGLLRREEAENLAVSQIYDLLFHAGFSTRDRADAFAGRGVGMDVVRTRLQELRGTIVIDSEVGRGTTFTIRLPLTLSITKALYCISNRARIAFPFDGVEDMFDIPRDQLISNEDDQACIQWREMMLPVRHLSDLLRYNRSISRSSVYAGTSDEDMLALVILRSAGEYLAVHVDRVEGEMDIVIKQLEGPVPKPVGIAGATVLADGQVMPIADVLELIDIAKGRTRHGVNPLWESDAYLDEPTETPAAEPLVLIVDDSITVRELLSMSFAKAGYRVEQARDGQEAWEKLRSGLPCNLVFCDIEMPRMTGLELLERLQKDDYLKTLPIAMLTSRGADRHRNLAAKFGARGYFTKPYLEESLLEAASRLLKGEVLINQAATSES